MEIRAGGLLAAHRHLADRAAEHFGAALVDDAHLDTGQRQADRTEVAPPVAGRHAGDRTEFGEAVPDQDVGPAQAVVEPHEGRP